MKPRISVVGLGKLGESIAAAVASRGLEVIGVDVRRDLVESLRRGETHSTEPEMAELIARNRSRIDATTSHRDAVDASDVTFVVVPTPSDERGAFALEYAEDAFRECGRALASKQSAHTLVMMSTVLPGATRHRLLPAVEEEAGRPAGDGYGVCYSPQFVALGSVVRDFLNPDFLLIGESDAGSGASLEAAYAAIMPQPTQCARMSLENAELTKLAVNTFVTTKITFANMLAGLCERIPGGDVDVVSNALGLDRRIGRRYLSGGLGYGGPCFPRDNLALSFLARSVGMRAELAETTDAVNRQLPARILERLDAFLPAGASVAVLGLAYKPATPVTEESQGMDLVRGLLRAGRHVLVSDPLACDSARKEFGERVEYFDSPVECVRRAEAVLITTADPAFAAIPAASFDGKTVADLWRTRNDLRNRPAVRYLGGGLSGDDPAQERGLAELWAARAHAVPG